MCSFEDVEEVWDISSVVWFVNPMGLYIYDCMLLKGDWMVHLVKLIIEVNDQGQTDTFCTPAKLAFPLQVWLVSHVCLTDMLQ